MTDPDTTDDPCPGARVWKHPGKLIADGSWTPSVLAAPGLAIHDGRMYVMYHA